MRFLRSSKILLLALLVVLSMIPLYISVNGYNPDDEYWYGIDEFEITEDAPAYPFFSLTDAYEGYPLRGFNSKTRTAFFDYGSFEWFSDWVENVWEYELSPYDRFEEVDTNNKADAFEYYFQSMKERLYMHLSMAYANSLISIPFKVWVPLIVIDDLSTNGYENSNLTEWIADPEIIENTLDESFPLIEWETDLFWFNNTEAASIIELVHNTTTGANIYLTNEFLNSLDDLMYDLLVENNLTDHQLSFPAVLFLNYDKTLYYPNYGPVGGLGQIESDYSEIGSWCVNGRNQNAYFYGGDQTKPRDSLTSTVIHELGHCVGLPHPHDRGSWFLDCSTESTMTYYSRGISFDQLDRDLVNNGLSLQLMDKNIDEINDLLSDKSVLNNTQIERLNELNIDLINIKSYLIDMDYENILISLNETDAYLQELTNILKVSRKTNNFRSTGTPLDVQLDFILGPGIESIEDIYNNIEEVLETTDTISINQYAILPQPVYNLTTKLYKSSENFNEDLTYYWKTLLEEDTTSYYNPDKVSAEDWIGYPLDNIFSTIDGYSVDAYQMENFLQTNPATINNTETIHYRFYIFNMENAYSQYNTSEQTNTDENSSTPAFTVLFVINTFCFYVLFNRKRSK